MIFKIMLDLLHPALLALLFASLEIRLELRAASVNPAAVVLSKAPAEQVSAYHARLVNTHQHKPPQLVLFARLVPTKAPSEPQERAYHAWLANMHPPKQPPYVPFALSVPTKAPLGQGPASHARLANMLPPKQPQCVPFA
jgi:hypothetical protein